MAVESLAGQEGTRKSTRLHPGDGREMVYMLMELALLWFLCDGYFVFRLIYGVVTLSLSHGHQTSCKYPSWSQKLLDRLRLIGKYTSRKAWQSHMCCKFADQ